jgi:tRNA (mo5U34)-methyltransferase
VSDDDAVQWYHSIELAPGEVTPGWFDLRSIADRLPWPDLRGKRCLDVGTFDGFWAFEMERRGAAEVHAVDVIDPYRWDWPADRPDDVVAALAARKHGGNGFEMARAALGSAVTREERSVYELSPDAMGTFDVVYVGSLLLHLRDPVGALMAARSVCTGELLLLDAIDPLLTRLFGRLPIASLDGRGRPWWWWPNLAALVRMAEAAGLELVRPPIRLRMPPGNGQPKLPARVLRTREGRRQFFSARSGDPHAALLLRPVGEQVRATVQQPADDQV